VSEEFEAERTTPEEIQFGDLLYQGFGIFWANKGLLICAQLILLAILLGGDYLLRGVGGNVLLGPFVLGLHKINLSVVRNRDTEIGDILSGFEQFLPAFLANILIHLGVILGVGLLIVPGLLVGLTYAPTHFFILEHNMGFWDAMESSRKMTWGNKKLWLTLGLLLLGINIAGALCFVVGLVVTVPYSRVLVTLVYEKERERVAREADLAPVEAPELS
jgi:uncharacterized membrane protein